MNTPRRIAAFVMVVLAASAWPMLTTVFEAPVPAAAACILAFAFVLAILACIGLSDATDASDPRFLLCALAAALTALFLPWPAWLWAAGLALGVTLGVAFHRRARGHDFAAGTALFSIVMLVQAAGLALSAPLMARFPDCPVTARVLAALLRFVGVDAAAFGGSVAIVAIRETHRFPATLGLLGFPTMFLALAGALLAGFMLTPRGRRLRTTIGIVVVWLLYLPVRAALSLVLFLYLQMFVEYASPTVRVDVLYSAGWQLALLLPLGLAWGLLRRAPAPDAERTTVLGSFRWRVDGLGTLAALAGAALIALAFSWHEAGTPRARRVMIDESHSDWEKSTRAPGTQWYGIDSMYNMYSITDYLGYYYDVRRNITPIDDKATAWPDVIILKTPTKPYSSEEIAAMVAFVRRGGGIFAIGEHTNFVGSAVYLNSVLARMGVALRSDCAFNLADPSPYVEVWDRPAFGVHPIMANVPRFRFEVSCTIDPFSPAVDDVMISSGLYQLDADYFMENYYPQPRRYSAMRFGSFTQLAALDFGRGRVAVFTDSTTMSNFSSLYPGRAEMVLGTVDWLGRTHTNGFWRGPVGLAGAALLGWAAWMLLRRPDGVGAAAALVAAVALGTTLALAGSTAAVLRRIPTPPPHTPPVHVGFVRGHCNYELPLTNFISSADSSYDIFYQWVLRPRFFPRVRETLADAADDRMVVVINPSEAFPAQDVQALQACLERGGRGLVLLRGDTDAAAANSLIAPFGVTVEGLVSADPHPVTTLDGRPTGVVTRGRKIAGGSPFLAMDGVAVAATMDVGRGKLTVIGVGDAFRDAEMGCSNAAPLTADTLARFRMEFELLDCLREYLPESVRREVDADAAWMKPNILPAQ